MRTSVRLQRAKRESASRRHLAGPPQADNPVLPAITRQGA